MIGLTDLRYDTSQFGEALGGTFYELATSSLFGPGHYSAYVVIGNHSIQNPGRFTLE